jgi:hypothetical protein
VTSTVDLGALGEDGAAAAVESELEHADRLPRARPFVAAKPRDAIVHLQCADAVKNGRTIDTVISRMMIHSRISIRRVPTKSDIFW